MRKLVSTAVFLAFSWTLIFAAPPRDRDARQDDDDHHDHGRHLGWYKHYAEDRDEHRDKDYKHARVEPGRYYPHGRYKIERRIVVLRSSDYPTRRVVLADRSARVIASYDIHHCRDWRWDRDHVQVYEDDVHAGWYVLFNARLGHHVHVEYSGR